MQQLWNQQEKGAYLLLPSISSAASMSTPHPPGGMQISIRWLIPHHRTSSPPSQIIEQDPPSGSIDVSRHRIPPQDRTPEHNLVTEQWVRQQQAVAAPHPETPRPPAAYTWDIPALGQNLVGVVTVAPRGQGSPSCSGPTTPGDPMSDKPSNGLGRLTGPPSPDYIPGPEEPQSPPLPDFVPEPAPYAEETEPFETDESAAIPPPLPQIPSPPLPQIPSPPLPVSSPVPGLSPSPPASPICPLNYRATMIRLRAEAASTSHLLPLPPPIILSHTRPDAPSSGIPPLHLLSTDRREDRPEVTLPPRKRLGIALGPRYEIGESSSAAAARPAGGLRADYGFVATMDRETGVIRRERYAGGRSQEAEAAHRGTEADKETSDSDDKELALLCGRMFPEESDKIEKYVGGLPDMIQRSVVASKPKTMQEATEIAIEVMDKIIRTFADRQTESKKKNTGRDYAAGTVEKKQYGGSKPLCSKCNYHHDGPCAPKCHKCNKVGYFARACRRHFKRECPKLKNNNNNHGNQVGGGNAPAKVYAVGHARTNPDSNVVTGMFLLNNRYASILFDTGADRSFVSTELADGRIIGLNTILMGCTLNILNHPFNIDLMPVKLGSFDAIIGMDWTLQEGMSKAEEQQQSGNQVRGGNAPAKVYAVGHAGTNPDSNIVTEYMLKGCPVFLANVNVKEEEDKSKEKRLEDVPIVRDFPEVFPEDLPGLPPTRISTD
ncbi:putative reverse transcriptase domain-containing protein [Tanacetum coccineum]